MIKQYYNNASYKEIYARYLKVRKYEINNSINLELRLKKYIKRQIYSIKKLKSNIKKSAPEDNTGFFLWK